jgi:arabinose-5-phosphate isomerase
VDTELVKKTSNDNKQKFISIGYDVIKSEIEGIKALESILDDNFLSIIDILLATKGRVIISGMGKSGHIARKIVATLASTGTAASFVHPGEASHGDLGMITQDDSVILLSNSGETSELHDIINYTRRFNIPLIGIVRRPTSTLVKASDKVFILPEIPEASGTVNAPTTSTTMMLALGDIISMVLMEAKGFSNSDFGIFHPGGKIGKAFIKVQNLMHRNDKLPLVDTNTRMSEVLIEMTTKSLGCAGVVDESGVLIGIVTDGDLRRHMTDDLVSLTASDVMTANPVTIHEESLAVQALSIMQDKKITALFAVSNDDKPVGIIHFHNILQEGVA